MSTSPRKTAAVVAAFAATVTLGGASVATADSDSKPKLARVTGSSEFRLPFSPDKDVRSFSFDAQAAPYSVPLPGIPSGMPTDARGTVKVSHFFADEGVTHTAEGKVDCLVTGPHTASLTAVITKVSPGGPDWVGKRLGFSVYDGGKDKPRSKDRVGFSWAVNNLVPHGDKPPTMAEVGTCMAPAPYAPVTKGGYTVEHAELPLMPKLPEAPKS